MKNKELSLRVLPNDAGIVTGHTRDEITLLFEDPEILYLVETAKIRTREMLFDVVSDRADYGDNLWLR